MKQFLLFLFYILKHSALKKIHNKHNSRELKYIDM